MPDDAPAVKQAATRSYGAEIILYNRQQTTREQLSQELATARGLTIIPPFDHPHVIAGQGTAALELFAEVGKLDLLLVCCGGGGLLSGCAIAAKALNPKCRVIGVEPEQADDAARSFRTGILQTIHNPDTIADGARTPALGKITFPLIRQYVDDIITVSESGIIRAMFYLWERLKIVVEPTGALATAAILENVVDVSGMRVGAIISGGNVDLVEVSQLFARSENLHAL
jgi:threo-3-hydroxy-L-aspartate ammonia-lyase